MSRIAYVNGRYVPHREGQVHIEDRGFQFADAVYEVCEVHDGQLVDTVRHLDRLARSLREIEMAWPVTRSALVSIMRETVTRNRVRNGQVYLQVSRGQAKRDFAFPSKAVKPTLVVTARSTSKAQLTDVTQNGIRVITMPDIRWKRVDIKSTAMLAQVLAKQAARSAGAGEAWMVDEEGFVTEGSSSSAWIVGTDGTLITRPANGSILPGVTRLAIMDYAAKNGIRVEERFFTVEEAQAAREAFITAATATVTPVTQVDDKVLGNGKPGSVASGLRSHFHDGLEAISVAPY
ncbi:MAG: D-amino-acid transaminase [Pseudomonadota bacterium]